MTRTVFGAVVASAAVALFACQADDETGETPRVSTPVDDAGRPIIDAAVVKREAGVPAKCATLSGQTSGDSCSCGETESPFTGAATEKCPVNDAPHYCVSYDVVATPLRRECTCQPKCLFQKVSGTGGEGGAGAIDTCRCGVASHLILGGNGSRDEVRPACEGFAVCCRFAAGCDCTSDVGFTCPAGAQKVASCGPADFNEKNWKAQVYGNPAYTDLVDVDRCR